MTHPLVPDVGRGATTNGGKKSTGRGRTRDMIEAIVAMAKEENYACEFVLHSKTKVIH